MKYFLTAAALVSALVWSFSTPRAEARGGRFSERDIRGNYSVSFDGEITEGPIVGHIVAVGLVRADGKGHFTFTRIANINGMVVLPQSGNCSYSVNPDGTGMAECTVSTPGQPDTMETYAFTIVDREEVDFVSTTSGAAVLGVGKKQSKHQGDDDD